MNKNSVLTGVFAIFMWVSCGNKQLPNANNSNSNTANDSLATLNQQIMHVHDDAMQYNAYILKLKRLINQKIDSATTNTVSIDSLRAISAKLYLADRKMLDWMHGYKTPEYSNDSAISYLLKQKALIDDVHVITFEAIINAEKALNLPTMIKPNTHEH